MSHDAEIKTVLNEVESGYQMLVIKGQDRGRKIPLTNAEINMGRKSGEDDESHWITFSEPTVSRHHASLVWSEKRGSYTIYHKSKTNPTLVNGKRVQNCPLSHEDIIQMGHLIIRVEFVGTADVAPPATPRRTPSSAPAPRRADPSPSRARGPVEADVAEEDVPLRSGLRLVVTEGPDSGSVFPLDRTVLFIGRRDGSEDVRGTHGILLNDDGVPKEQVLLAWNEREQSYGIFPIDHSVLPTRIMRMEDGDYQSILLSQSIPMLLRADDVIQFGDTSIRLELEDAAFESSSEHGNRMQTAPSRPYGTRQDTPEPDDSRTATRVLELRRPSAGRDMHEEVRRVSDAEGARAFRNDREDERPPPSPSRPDVPSSFGYPRPGPAAASGYPRPAPSTQPTAAPASSGYPQPRADVASAPPQQPTHASVGYPTPPTSVPPSYGYPQPPATFGTPNVPSSFGTPSPAPNAPMPPEPRPAPPSPPPVDEIEKAEVSDELSATSMEMPFAAPPLPSKLEPVNFPVLDVKFVRNLPTRADDSPPRIPPPAFPIVTRTGSTAASEAERAPTVENAPVTAPDSNTVPTLKIRIPGFSTRNSMGDDSSESVHAGAAPSDTPGAPGLPLDYRPPELDAYDDEEVDALDFHDATFAWRYRADYIIGFLEGRNRGQKVELLTSQLQDGRRITLGRRGERVNDIEVDDPGVINAQSTLTYSGGRFSLLNEGKEGSVFLNQSAVPPGEDILLKTGDRIGMGESLLIFLERAVVQVLSRYELVVLTGVADDRGRSYDLLREVVVVGRTKSCDVPLSDSEVSRKHLAISLRNGRFYLTHISSSNPTFVNGISLPRGRDRIINDGDKIQLSDHTTLLFRARGGQAWGAGPTAS